MTIDQIAAKFPEWSRRTVVEAWLQALGREGTVEAVEAEFGVTFDANGEVDLSNRATDEIDALFQLGAA